MTSTHHPSFPREAVRKSSRAEEEELQAVGASRCALRALLGMRYIIDGIKELSSS
jgi:hypothetical protein